MFSDTQMHTRRLWQFCGGIFVSATSQLLQNSRQLQTSQPAACEFNTQLDLLAAHGVKLVSAAAENGAVFPLLFRPQLHLSL